MQLIRFKNLFLLILLLSLISLMGCAGREFAPKYAVWYYPHELVKADRAVADAQKAGKDKTCPVEFKEAKKVKDQAYETYLACHTKEAIEMANKAFKMAKALCPANAKKEAKVIDKFTIMVNFDFDKAAIRDVDKPELKKALDFVKKYPGAKIKVEGHTDSKGSVAYNKKLSKKRAITVKNFLIKEGAVNAKKIKAVGYGKSKPIDSNKTEEGRAKNRRVEILILSD
jgi:OmpA-OmpF porin, OOP family